MYTLFWIFDYVNGVNEDTPDVSMLYNYVYSRWRGRR